MSLYLYFLHSFFKQDCFFFKYLLVSGFLQSGALYANIPGVNIIGGQVSIESANRTGRSGGALRPQWWF